MDEEQIELIWQYYESQEQEMPADLRLLDARIICSFGMLDVFRKTIQLTHWDHKYANLCDPIKAKNILTLNRLIARRFGQEEMLYFPDSSFPTSMIDDKVLEGHQLKDIKAFSIKEFGHPPHEWKEAFRYMFFIDHFDRDFGELEEWEWGTEGPYWRYNSESGRYEQKKKLEPGGLR